MCRELGIVRVTQEEKMAEYHTKNARHFDFYCAKAMRFEMADINCLNFVM